MKLEMDVNMFTLYIIELLLPLDTLNKCKTNKNQCRESGSWLHAIPSPNIGTLLDNTSFQVCIGLRLGCNLCTPHICKCNAKVDEIGIHGLSCSKSSFQDTLKLILLSTGL
jgi:hypothetical protein